MIGVFFVTTDNLIGFAQYGSHQKINNFTVSENRSCSATIDENEIVNFTHALAPEIYNSLLKANHIAVGHMSDNDKVLEEYIVPAIVAR